MSDRTRYVASAVMCLAAVAVAMLGGVETAGAAAANADWKVGDCYADANVDFDSVNLASKVPCSKTHDVQVIGGAPLPASLAAAGLATLTSTSSAVRPELVAFADKTCAPTAEAASVYPKIAKKLQALLGAHDVTDWVLPAAGRMGWVLPDQAAFDAGAKDLVCIFEPVASATSSGEGDILRLSTKDPLATLRVCRDFSADNSHTNNVSCQGAHDQELLFRISQDVTGHPASVEDWTDADWAPYDKTCVELGKALVGSARADLIVRSDADGTQPVSQGRRPIDCVAYPTKKTQKLPGTSTVTGAGTSKIAFVNT